MNNLWEFLQNVDLYTTGQTFLTLTETTNPILSGILLGVLTLLGAKMASPYPALRRWGLHHAVVTFLVYFGCTWFAHGGIETQDLPRVGLRALAAGLVLAPLWLVLPLVLFVFGRLRLMLAAFLISAGYAFFSAGGRPC